jgi:hypothetical protein
MAYHQFLVHVLAFDGICAIRYAFILDLLLTAGRHKVVGQQEEFCQPALESQIVKSD